MARKPLSRYTTPDESPGYQLWLISNLWQRRLRSALRDLNLTHVQFSVMALTDYLNRESDSVTQVQVARACGIDQMMTSQVIRTLVDRGLMEREKHPTDSRAMRVNLTPAGAALMPSAVQRAQSLDDELFGTMGEDGQKMLDIFKRIVQMEHRG